MLWRPRVTIGNKRTEQLHLICEASALAPGHSLSEAFPSLLGTNELSLQIIATTSVFVILPLPTPYTSCPWITISLIFNCG